jgi:hypothetical protein
LARVCTLDDAVLSDEDEDDDELQWTMASLMVVVATSIRWRRCAKAWLKLSVTVDFECPIPAASSRSCGGFRVRRERGYRGFYRRAGVG